MKKIFLTLICAVLLFGCKKDSDSSDSGTNNGGTNDVYAVGDYYNRDGVEGVVYRISNGGTHGMIVSMDEAMLSWGAIAKEANDNYDGKNNMEVIKRLYDINNFPAFRWCDNKNSDGNICWYLPAIEELEDVMLVYQVLNETLNNNGGVLISTNIDRYWSSCYVMYITYGMSNDGAKCIYIYT